MLAFANQKLICPFEVLCNGIKFDHVKTTDFNAVRYKHMGHILFWIKQFEVAFCDRKISHT